MTARRLWVVTVALAMATPAVAQEADDNPRLRWENFYERRAFPFVRVPEGALQRARAQARALEANRLFGAPPPISGTQWQALGPAAIPIFGTSTGRMSAIAVHPTDANTIYVGGAQGGVWKTTDGGASWTPLTDGECSLAMGSIALDPVNPDIVYAGTGEQHFSGDSYYGCGVLRSTNGGASWTPVGPGVRDGAGEGARISRVVIVPSTAGTPATTTVFAASNQGLFRSTDGGANWSEVLVGALGCGSLSTCSATDLVVHPGNDSIVYAAVRTRGVYRSTNQGANWTLLPSGFPTVFVGRINLALTPTAPDTLYAAVHNTSNSQLLGIWRTEDAGGSWSQLTASGASCGPQCWYNMHVTVHPTDPGTVYFGGVQLYRSTNGGGSFADITSFIHVDQHLMVFDPQNPQVVYAANDGGIYRSTDGGTSWTSINTGLELTQFYEGISLHPSDPTVVLGGTQDNGTLQYTGQPTWQHVLGGDGGYTAIDRENPAIRYAETQWGIGSSFSGPRRSDNGGSYIRKVNGIDVNDRALFIPPLVMDPTTSSTLYFGTFRLYRTTNRAESWTAISPDLTGGGNGRISAIAPAPSDPQTIYVGASTGLVQVTTDGGATWTPRVTGLPTRFVQNMAVDRADPLTAYVVFSGFFSGHVFRTVNGGQTWTDVSGNLPDVPVNAVVVDPADRGIVMVGTDVGVYVTADSGGTWTPLPQGLPNAAVYDIAYNPATATLIAATHGRGMFQLQLNRPLTVAVVPRVRRDSVPFGAAGPRADSAAVVLTGTGAGSAGWSATHAPAASWITLTAAGGTGSGTVRWTRDPSGLASGIYVDTITVTAAGAVDSPWRLLDSLVVGGGAPAIAITPGATGDTAVSGTAGTRPGSTQLVLSGGADSTTAWTATTTGAAWLTLLTTAGQGSATISWTRSSFDVPHGLYRDTITVVTAGADTARVVDEFLVRAPVTATACASDHLLGRACLSAVQLRWLDLTGNRDGQFNLGDFVAFLNRGGGTP